MANEKRLDLVNRGELLDSEYLVSMDGALGYVVDSEIVRRAKRVDAVEVVRCKDCKHYNVFRLECHNGHMNGVIGVDGFCSYGERKDNEVVKKV